MPVSIRCIESEPFAENSYLVWTDGPQAVVVDPGFDPEAILDLVRKERLEIVAILNTHGHVDHIAGNAAIKEAFPGAPLIIGRGDAAMLTDARLNLSGLFGFQILSPAADRLVDEGEEIAFAGCLWQVRNLPGHSPGHVVFIMTEQDPVLVFGGDVLFQGGIGRTDFPGGSFPQLAEGIRNKLYPLPDSTRVFPGHGPATTIGEEKRSNPYVPARDD